MGGYNELAKMYEGISMGEDCPHENAVSRDSDGIYTFHCPQCGRYAVGNEAVARYLGWIDDERG